MKVFRKATTEDITQIMDIVNAAKAYMKRSGIDQWQDGYPDTCDYIDDIQKGISYVVEEDGEVIAVTAVDFEHSNDYDTITEGDWLTHKEYGAIHRVAVKENLKGSGIGGFIVAHAVKMCLERKVPSLRCDTHEDNLSMQRMLEKGAFERCGIVYVGKNKLRFVAFERVL